MDQNSNGQKVFRCKYCGNIINPGNMFCASCGAALTSTNRPNRTQPIENVDDLPVINTDEIFGDLDYTSHINTKNETNQEDLPVIDVDGLFDDVPYANTSNYQTTNSQYYNMSEDGQPVEEQPMSGEPPMQDQPGQPIAPGRSTQQSDMYGGQDQQMQAQRNVNVNQGIDPQRVVTPPISADEDADVEDVEEEETTGSNKKKFIILGVLIAIVAAIAIWFFGFHNKGKRADLIDLCSIKFTGTNGNGNIELAFNERCDLYDDFAVVDNTAACEELKKITFQATPNTGLKNGDKVTIYANYSSADLGKYKINVKKDKREVVVDGLTDSAAYDLFSGIRVKFEGYDGSGKAEIDTSGCDEFTKANVRYSFEGMSESLKNGDTVIVVATVDDHLLEQNHYSVDAKKKNYIVESLMNAQEYDVFKNVSIKYSGASPKLSLSIDTSTCNDFVKNEVEFSLSATENVKTGDKVTMTASFDENKAREKGYVINTKTKTFTIDNVSSYLNSINSTQAKTLNTAISSYLANNKSSNGNSYIFDKDLDELFNDGLSYTLQNTQESIAASYFLYNENKETLNSYLLIMKYTVTAKCNSTGEIRETTIFVESSVGNVYLGEDKKTLKYDSPSEVVTDTELNYFINQVNASGYSISKIK